MPQGATSKIAIDVRGVRKNFAEVIALREISLAIQDREFFTLLGPSGCGKTTLLRMIAGFESLSAGEIYLYGEEIDDLPANKRSVNTVFQQYALFPHMSVADNVKFGPLRLGQSERDASLRAARMLELVRLSEFAHRKPAQLSGGQQQRVALARALAPEPKVLLLDEPLSALDLKLRQAMRVELKQIQEETGITFVFVTHDQEEALTMSDRIAVMSAGELQQVGTATEIYEAPCNQFVADFIGESNLLPVTIDRVEHNETLCTLSTGLTLRCQASANATANTQGHICIRPERLSVRLDADAAHLNGHIERMVYLGTDTQIRVRLGDGATVLIRTQNTHGSKSEFRIGSKVGVDIDAGAARLLID